MLGTSLGVGVADGVPVEGGHANHVRVINEIRRHGSIAAAVDAGYVTGGVMHACVRGRRPVRARRLDPRRRSAARHHDRRRRRRRRDARPQVPGVRVALMLATTLHAIATGNVPAGQRRDLLRRHQPGRGHQARRPGLAPGRGHRHRHRRVRPPARRRSARPMTGGLDRRAALGAPVPAVPAAALRGALRDQPVDAPGGRGRRRRARSASGTRCTRRCVDAGAEVETIDQPEGVPDLVFTANAGLLDARHRVVRAVALPPPGAPARDRGVRIVVRRARLGRSAGCPTTSTTRAPATRCRSAASAVGLPASIRRRRRQPT